MSEWQMSRAQLKRYAQDDIDRMADSSGLASWLPDAVPDLSKVMVGVWRCIDAHDDELADLDCPYPEGECECCDCPDLFESPISDRWEPECMCGRPALLVRIEGERDYSHLLG